MLAALRWVATTASFICLASVAEAQSPYTLRPAVDVPLLGVGLSVSVIGLLEVGDPPTCIPSCDASRLNALDRTVLSYHSQVAGDVADAVLYTLAVAPFVLDAIDSKGDGWWSDAFVIFQTMLLAQAAAQLIKSAVGRNAPLAYASEEVRAASPERDLARSFPSAHTAMASAAVTAYTVTYWLRHPDDPARFLVLSVGALLAFVPGVLKVAAGGHFWTEVAAGYVLGTSLGVLVPLLHVNMH